MCKIKDDLIERNVHYFHSDPKDELVSYCPQCNEEATEDCGHCPHCKEPIDVVWVNPETDEEVDLSLI